LERGRPGEVYNVGGDAECENLHVVRTICALLDARQPRADGQPRETQIAFVPDRPGHDRRYAIDAGKIQAELGWKPQVDFETGMASTADWYLANGPWVQRILDGSYALQRLGAAA